MRTSAPPASCRTTTRSDTLMRLEKWVQMWRICSTRPCSTWSRSSSTPTDFTIQGVAVLRLSRNTSLVMSWSYRMCRWALTSSPALARIRYWRKVTGRLVEGTDRASSAMRRRWGWP